MQQAIAPSSNAAGATRASCRCRAAAVVTAPTAPLGTANSRQPSGMQLLASIADRVCSLQPVLGPAAPAYSTTSQSEDLDMVYDELEEIFYSKRGYNISQRERRLIESTGGHPTYGELMPAGIDSMLEIMTGGQPCQGSVFADLGSGLGRVCIQTALSQQYSPFDRIIGAELSPSRLEQAQYVLEQLQKKYSHQPELLSALQRVEFREEDCTCGPALQQATHVFMCSTAFGATACRRIVEQLYASSKFQVLITSRELPFQPYLIKLGEFACETSWIAAGTGHVYVRHDLYNAPAHLLRRYLSDGAMCWLPTGTVCPHLPVSAQEPIEGWKVRWLAQPLLPAEGAAAN